MSQAIQPNWRSVERLRQAVGHHQYRYYILDDPGISDPELTRSGANWCNWRQSTRNCAGDDSLTGGAGGFVAEKFEKVRHPTPMLSLATNAFGLDDPNAWRERQTLLACAA